MTTIQKITKIQHSPTKEKLENSWKQIRSLRITLLKDTDWIFAADANLTKSCMAAWVNWRDKVRKSKSIEVIEEAAEYLQALHNNRPEVMYANEKPSTLDSYKKLLHEALRDSLKRLYTSVADEYGGRDVLMEKFEEARRFKDGKDEYILIEIEADYTNTPIETVVENAIQNRQKYLEKLIRIERSKHLHIKHIETVDSFDECDKLLDTILIFGDKKWISTLT